ncbi:MAG: hypothetical protein C0592_10565 [Marinilabiliales bacterium]|nr:MAG: hypothetical protein C0592_10565 [Marinilabiliales bacterium]
MKDMLKIVRIIEKTIFIILIFFLAATLLISVIDFGLYFFRLIFQSPMSNWYEPEFLMPLFSSFLVVLIGVELLETIKAYFKDDSIHVEIIILVAIIALARKIIILDYTEASTGKLLGIAAITLALGGAYFLIKKAGITIRLKKNDKDNQQSTGD